MGRSVSGYLGCVAALVVVKHVVPRGTVAFDEDVANVNDLYLNSFVIMSVQYGKLCSLLLLEHFGEIVQHVGYDLFKWGSRTLRLLITGTGLPSLKVKQALRVLIQYGFVTFVPGQHQPNTAEYTLHPEKVYLLLRYPKYLLLIKTQYGDEAEMVVEELLRQGQAPASHVILNALKRLKENCKGQDKITIVTVRDKFNLLITKQFLMRCPSPTVESAVPILTVKERELYLPPEINLKVLLNIEQGRGEDPGDENVYWRINFDRFHQEFRDKIMISSISKRIDENGAELMRLLLRQMYLRTDPWVATSNPIPMSELRDAVRKLNTHPALVQYVEQYIKIMADEDSSRFVMRVGDSGGGGQYSVNVKEAFIQLSWTTIENIVLERFGTKAARIFRLIREKKFIEQEQIQQKAMIPAKEAKLLTYKLLEENFIQIQELRKTMSANGPNKSFFLFHIELSQVVRMVLELCYKAMYNAMTRREHERSENKRLIEKQQRIESITVNLRGQGATQEQIAEIEDMLTPPELTLLEKIRTMINRLTEAEFQLDDTVFILQLYMSYL